MPINPAGGIWSLYTVHHHPVRYGHVGHVKNHVWIVTAVYVGHMTTPADQVTKCVDHMAA